MKVGDTGMRNAGVILLSWRLEGEWCASLLHHEERGDEDEGRTAIHIDGGTDGQYEASRPWADTQALLGTLDGDGQSGGTALGEEGHQHGGHHPA